MQFYFTDIRGTSVVFDPLNDVLTFPNYHSPTDFTFQDTGTGVRIRLYDGFTTLEGASFATLTAANFEFPFGGVVELGGAGDDSLQSSNYVRDYFDISLGGADTVNAGGADDVIEAGTGFSADDVINGGDGNDTLLISGVQPAPVIMNSTTLTAVETIAASAGSGVNLVLNNSNVAGLYFGTTLTFDSTAQTADDSSIVDGSLITAAR